jgi:hypothetical protein
MDGLDFKNLSAEQEKVLREILETCDYFHSARHCNVPDGAFAEQARALGSKFQQLERTLEEKKGI